MSEGPALKDGARLDWSGIAGWFELMCQSTWSLRAPCSNPLVHSLRPCRETPVGHKEKQKYICCSLPGSRAAQMLWKTSFMFCFFFSFPKQKLSKHGKISSLRFCCPVQRKQFVMLLMHVTENTTEVGADHVAGLSLSGFAFVMNPGCWLQFTGSVGIFLLDRGLFSVDELILRLLYAVRS